MVGRRRMQVAKHSSNTGYTRATSATARQSAISANCATQKAARAPSARMHPEHALWDNRSQ
eukprot:9900970-Alexandrium_andersonii.AAC.1